MALKMHHSIAVHPGPWIRSELLEPKGVTINALVEAFGVSRQALSNLLNGRGALSADMAIRFEKAFGISADTLVRMQAAYDLSQSRARSDQLVVGKVLEPA